MVWGAFLEICISGGGLHGGLFSGALFPSDTAQNEQCGCQENQETQPEKPVIGNKEGQAL